MLTVTHDSLLDNIGDDGRQRVTDDILSQAERRQQYRQRLIAHQAHHNMRLKQFVLMKRRHLRGLDLLPRRKRAEDIDLMCRYFNGDQYGCYDELGYYLDRRQEGDFAYAIPVLSGHVEQAFLQLYKVTPQYSVTAQDQNDASKVLMAKMCEAIGPAELTRVMEPRYQTEIYNMIISGESDRFTGWEPNKVSPKVAKRPVYKLVEKEIPARRECRECKAPVVDGAQLCARCGSMAVEDFPAGKSQQNEIERYDEVKLGENTVHIPHMLAMQRDMSAVEPEDSSFLIEYSYVDRHQAEWDFQCNIEPTREGLPVEMLLRFDLERGSNQTDAIMGSARLAPSGREGSFGQGTNATAPFRKQPLERHFWKPSEYGQFYCTTDEKLPNGQVIPRGTLLGDYYPDGAFVLIVGDTIMEMDPCIVERKHVLIRYGRIAGSNSGAGLKKIMPLQDAANDNFNLGQTVKHTLGRPLTIINGHYINELPAAGNVLKITRAGVDDVNKVVAQFAGQTLSQGDGAENIIAGAMQFIAGTNTVGGNGVSGAADMRAAGTATGIAAMQEQAAARQAGPVGQRILADKEMIVQLLENIQRFSTPEQRQELEKRWGEDTVKIFFESNLRQELLVGIKGNSDMPKSMALTQANYIAFGQTIATILPEIQNYPWLMEYVQELASSMGFPSSLGEGRNDRREAEYRLNLVNDIEAELSVSESALLDNPIAFAARIYEELAKKCAPLIQGEEPEDPAASTMPNEQDMPRVFLQYHPSYLDVYKDAILGEKAKGWSQSHRLCVIQMWLDHKKAELTQQAVLTQFQAMLQQQMMPPEPAPDPNAVNPEEAASADHERLVEQGELDHQRQLELQAAEHDAGEQREDAALERRLVEEGHRHDNALALERARPKARPSRSTA